MKAPMLGALPAADSRSSCRCPSPSATTSTTGVTVERGTQRALFLDLEEAETLGKMIDYILEKVRIKPESEAALRSVRPRLDELFGEGLGGAEREDKESSAP